MTTTSAETLDEQVKEPSGYDRLAEPLAWCAAIAVAALALLLVGFTSQDPDSSAYAQISARLVGLPLHQWIAPEWWGIGGANGLFREHPVGAFLLPAILGKLGMPPMQGAYVVGVALSIAVLLLLRRVAALIVGAHDSAVVPWVALILPVAFINRIRATQEYPLFVCVLMAVYATERSRASAAWTLVLILAACGAALVKGVFVVFVPIVCGLWLLCTRGSPRGDLRAWLGLGLSMAAVGLGTIAYEHLYRLAAGDSFLDYYLSYRLSQIASAEQSTTTLVAGKFNNAGWYTARLLWFGFPGTLALLAAAATPTRVDRRGAGREMQGLYFAIGVAAAYVAVMSLGTTRAERFILPAYFSVGIAGTLVAVRRWDAIARPASRLANLPPYALALAWLLLVLAALPFEMYVPYVKFR